MNHQDLLVGSNPVPLEFPHFPTRQQAVIWRNWESVPTSRIASVLRTGRNTVEKAAAAMGLPVPARVCPEMLTRGYVGIVRDNWHLLPYEQLLQLLGWTARRMADTLRHEDFLWSKLGGLKPAAKPVYWRCLTASEEKRTAQLRALVEKHFPGVAAPDAAAPFDFMKSFRTASVRRPVSGRRTEDLRIIYPYHILYGDPLLDPECADFPAGLLARYAESGVNGIWLQGILHKLVPIPGASEFSTGWRRRVTVLRCLTERADKFGIGVYLYLNEPRGMPLSFFEKYPDWKGVEYPNSECATLCLSSDGVKEYLTEGSARLFRQVPGLAGVFTITRSENITQCWFRDEIAKQCPRCTRMKPYEVIAEVNRLIETGVHSVNPRARVIAWTWGWDDAWARKAIARLPAGVGVMCTSEESMLLKRGGVTSRVVDYTMSAAGPGARARGLWRYARRRGLKAFAKIQVNTTWECSAVPYLPVLPLVEKHLNRLKREDLSGVVMSWTLGGYPSLNTRFVEYLRSRSKGASLSSFARDRFGKEAASWVEKAWRVFAGAFAEFPFSLPVLYVGPQNYGPMNLLYAGPTGYRATMVGFPYDDLVAWRNIYPEEVFVRQWERVSRRWKKGLEYLERAERESRPEKRGEIETHRGVATAAWLHFRSAGLQVRFVGLRDRPAHRGIAAILDAEIECAKALHDIVTRDSTIGFEATNHYAYTRQNLREKVINCEYLKNRMCVRERR